MQLTKDMLDQLRSRYVSDFDATKSEKLRTVRQAEGRYTNLRTAVLSAKEKDKILAGGLKKDCAYLLHFYKGIRDPEAAKETKHKYDKRAALWYTRTLSMRDAIISLDLSFIMQSDQAGNFAQYLLKHKEKNLATLTIRNLYQDFAKEEGKKLRKTILSMVQTDAEMEYTEAMAMDRHFILHIGGTNSGKTYESIERLKQAQNGVYAGPLRLLALEIYDKLFAAGVPVSMVTGEEQVVDPDARVTSSTVEMVDLRQVYDVAVIDEAQMIADPFRGHVWSRLVMGIKAKEIHVCLAPEAEKIICTILDNCDAEYEIVRHQRNTELIFEETPFDIETDVQKGDALVLFSKRAVLDVAARLEMKDISVSVIYGSLPPQIRKKQFEMFLAGETEVVVATDAIGLGVNLPIRRIVFMENMKFDGQVKRFLNEFEVRQIAGRAGRRGMYDQGFVTATSEAALAHLKESYQMNHSIEYARIGFPQILLEIDQPIDTILTQWYQIKPSMDVYRKIDIGDYITKYKALLPIKEEIDGFEDKQTLFGLISCDVDLKSTQCMDLWKEYCRTYTAGPSVRFPEWELVHGQTGLERAETYYKMLDLYNLFSSRMGKVMDEERLRRERIETEETILSELRKNKKSYLKRCRYCRKVLPLGSAFSLCERCYRMY